jgi:hypothetical protein
MLHACLCTICFVFCYTSWHFYAFSGTNLLTRCHSASSLFSAIFVFHKSYTGNILWTKQKPKLLFFPDKGRRPKESRRGARGPPHQGVARPPPGRARGWCGPPGGSLTPPLCLYKASGLKTLNQSAIFQKKSRSSTAATDEFRGTEVYVPAPCRDGEVPSKPSPSMLSPPPPSPLTSPPSSSTLLSPMMRRE